MEYLAHRVGLCCYWDPLQEKLDWATGKVNLHLVKYSPLEIIICTLIFSFVLRRLHNLISSLWKLGIKAAVFRCAVKMPFVSGYIEKEKTKNKTEFWEKYAKARTDTIKTLWRFCGTPK